MIFILLELKKLLLLLLLKSELVDFLIIKVARFNGSIFFLGIVVAAYNKGRLHSVGDGPRSATALSGIRPTLFLRRERSRLLQPLLKNELIEMTLVPHAIYWSVLRALGNDSYTLLFLLLTRGSSEEAGEQLHVL
jgi:hypothetical protein